MIPNCKKDLDFYYPIGTYYETSNKDFLIFLKLILLDLILQVRVQIIVMLMRH